MAVDQTGDKYCMSGMSWFCVFVCLLVDIRREAVHVSTEGNSQETNINTNNYQEILQ